MLIAKTIQCIVFGPLRVSEKQVGLGFHLVEGLSTCHYIFWVFIKPFYSQQFAFELLLCLWSSELNFVVLL